MGCGFCCVMDCGFCCIVDFCSDHGCEYNPIEINTADHAKKTADDLAEMKEKAHREGMELGKEIFERINIFMKQFVDHLEAINAGTYGGKQLNLKINVIKKELEKLSGEVQNFIGDRLDERLVLTDKELSVILEEHDDKKRAKNFNAFYVRIHKQAVRDLIEKIEEVIKRQYALVDGEIRSRLEEVNADMKKADESYKELERMMEEKDTALAAKQVDNMYIIGLSDVVLDELKSAAE